MFQNNEPKQWNLSCRTLGPFSMPRSVNFLWTATLTAFKPNRSHPLLSNIIQKVNKRIHTALTASTGVSNWTVPWPFDFPSLCSDMSARTTLPFKKRKKEIMVLDKQNMKMGEGILGTKMYQQLWMCPSILPKSLCSQAKNREKHTSWWKSPRTQEPTRTVRHCLLFWALWFTQLKEQ